MQSYSRGLLPLGFAAGMLACAQLFVSPSYGQTGPFAFLAGTWSGSGTITTSNGGTERIRCRARYTVSEGGHAFEQSLTCASDSYKFEISCQAVAHGSTVTGMWQEATRNVNGTLSGTIRGQLIQAQVSAGSFSAGVAVTTSGRSQAVTIRPQGTDVTDVTVGLHK